MCSTFRLHNGVPPNEGRVEIKLGRFDKEWRPICGSMSSLLVHRRSNVVKPGQTSEPFFKLEHARRLCSVLGYRQVLSYYTDAAVGFGFGEGTAYTLQGQITSEYFEMYPTEDSNEFECDPRTAVSLRCLRSKLIKKQQQQHRNFNG